MVLRTLTSPTAVKLALHECDRLGREQFLRTYGFRPAREYLLIWNETEYDSKAVAGVAYGYQFPQSGALRAEQFSGGIDSGNAAHILHKLGFDIRGMVRNPNDWTLTECEVTADAYFEGLERKLRREPYVRVAALRKLVEQTGRPRGAVDRTFQNIDAILHEAELPRLNDGISPDVQTLMRFVTLDPLARRMEWAAAVPIPPIPPSSRNVFVNPPNRQLNTDNSEVGTRAVKIDFSEREARNRNIGTTGEEFVLEVERDRLMQRGGRDLAEKAKWVSRELGDGLGYDIESVDEDGEPLLIEVKATLQGKGSLFFVTENELRVARREGKRYRLYRVFDLLRDPKIYVLEGPLEDKLSIQAQVYIASPLWTGELLTNCARAAVPDGTTTVCANATSKLTRARKARGRDTGLDSRKFENMFILKWYRRSD